jgi:hypothetical protein
LAKRIGAPYGPFEGSIRLDSSNSTIYVFNSDNSVASNGYKRLLGAGAFSSTSGIRCSKTSTSRLTG